MALRTSAPKVTDRRFSSTIASLFATIETYKGISSFVGELDQPTLSGFWTPVLFRVPSA